VSAQPPAGQAHRYAVYALPGVLAPDPLRALAEAWIGRTVDGRALAPAVPRGWSRDEVDAITVDARRYGFHLTLKAPFRLADGIDADTLDARVSACASAAAPATVPRVRLRLLDGFFALVPGTHAPQLHTLADAVVRAFDDLRAPLTDTERARRRPQRLTAHQRALLDTWGYPYVLDELLPHLTLTDAIDERDRPRVQEALTEHLAGVLGRYVPVDALCVVAEPQAGAPFVLRSVHPLQGTQPTPVTPATAMPAVHARPRGEA